MKKILSFALAAAIIGSGVIAITAHAENLVAYGSLTVDIDSGIITKCDENIRGSVIIPDKVQGVEIKSVGDYAFYHCLDLSDVTIPDGVETIGDGAFSQCPKLSRVTIPDGLKIIGNNAFGECTWLNGLTLPDGLISIGAGAFFNSGLVGITIPESVNFIGESAFSKCIYLTGVKLPEGMTTVSDYMFGGCTYLENINLPDSITYIGKGAFGGCERLTNITIPNAVLNIGDNAFHGCKALKSITIPEGVTTIGESAFGSCSELRRAIIPDTIKSIGKWSFADCYRLEGLYYNGISEQWKKIEFGEYWESMSPLIKIYVMAPTTTVSTVQSSNTVADNSADDGGATGFTATIEPLGAAYKLGNVAWAVTSDGIIKHTDAISYGDITISSGAVQIGVVITGVYDPNATAQASYEKTIMDYVQYTG